MDEGSEKGLKRVDRGGREGYIRLVGPVSKVVAVCLAAVVLAGGVVLSAAARGGHASGDSGNHQYGSKPACKQYKKGKQGKGSRTAQRSTYGYAKDCPKYRPHHQKKPRYER
jgi:hypothetical protein